MPYTPAPSEIDRFLLALAAEEVSGRTDGPVQLGEIVPPHRRCHLFARPDGEGVRFGISGLEAALAEVGQPHLVDWRRDSEYRGLRYTTQLLPLPARLAAYAGKEAEAEWRAWRAEVKEEQHVLVSAALRGSWEMEDGLEMAGREAGPLPWPLVPTATDHRIESISRKGAVTRSDTGSEAAGASGRATSEARAEGDAATGAREAGSSAGMAQEAARHAIEADEIARVEDAKREAGQVRRERIRRHAERIASGAPGPIFPSSARHQRDEGR